MELVVASIELIRRIGREYDRRLLLAHLARVSQNQNGGTDVLKKTDANAPDVACGTRICSALIKVADDCFLIVNRFPLHTASSNKWFEAPFMVCSSLQLSVSPLLAYYCYSAQPWLPVTMLFGLVSLVQG